MREEDTICYLIAESIDKVRESLTGRFDAIGVAKNLAEMRTKAQRMENALKLRKKLMIEAGIEEKYQELKKKEYTPKKGNNIGGVDQQRIGKIDFTLIIKEGEKELYNATVSGGVLSVCEEIASIDEFGAITGKTQQLTFGHDLVILHTFLQLQHSLEGKLVRFMTALRNTVSSGKFKDKEFTKAIMERTNKKPI